MGDQNSESFNGLNPQARDSAYEIETISKQLKSRLPLPKFPFIFRIHSFESEVLSSKQ